MLRQLKSRREAVKNVSKNCCTFSLVGLADVDY